jgi:hypothetical protein
MSNAASLLAAASFSDVVAAISEETRRGDPGVGGKGGDAGALATAAGESFMMLSEFRVASA